MRTCGPSAGGRPGAWRTGTGPCGFVVTTPAMQHGAVVPSSRNQGDRPPLATRGQRPKQPRGVCDNPYRQRCAGWQQSSVAAECRALLEVAGHVDGASQPVESCAIRGWITALNEQDHSDRAGLCVGSGLMHCGQARGRRRRGTGRRPAASRHWRRQPACIAPQACRTTSEFSWMPSSLQPSALAPLAWRRLAVAACRTAASDVAKPVVGLAEQQPRCGSWWPQR